MPARALPDLALLLITLLWGTSFSLTKGALQDASPAALLAGRFALATATLAIAALFAPRPATPAARRALWRDGAGLGLLMALGFALQTEGIAHTTSSRAAFFTGLTVLLVPFVSALLYRRTVAPRAWFAAVTAAVGLALISHPAARASGATLLGDLLSLGCAVVFAFLIVWTGEWSGRHPLTRLTAIEVGVAFAALLPVIATQPLAFSASPALVGTVAFLGAGLTAGAFVVQNWAQRRVTPVRAALIYTMEPLSAVLFAYLHRGDRLSGLEWVGGALVIAGVVVGEVGAAFGQRERG